MSAATELTADHAPPRADDIDLGAAGGALLFSALWGGLSSTVKVALDYFPRLGLAGARFGLGLLAIALWAAATRQSLRLTRHEWRAVLPLALLFIAQIAAFNVGIDKGSASHAVVLVNTHPLFVALLAHYFIGNDRLDVRKLCGLVAAFAGIIVMFSEQFIHAKHASMVGDAIGLLSGFLLGAILVKTKLLTQSISPLKVLVGQYVVGVPTFLLLSALVESPAQWHPAAAAVLPLLYQGVIISGLCFVGMTRLLQRYPASKITAFSFTTPVFGAFISHAALGDPLTKGLLFGVALVALGIFIANRQPNGSLPVMMD